jgi:hypothetical protein
MVKSKKSQISGWMVAIIIVILSLAFIIIMMLTAKNGGMSAIADSIRRIFSFGRA